MSDLVSMKEVSKHNTSKDCWVVFHGKVYNLTKWLSQHPGGIDIIAKHAGKDATEIFDTIHSKGMLITLPKSCLVGNIDPKTVTNEDIAHTNKIDNSSVLPPIDNFLNLYDFQAGAHKVMNINNKQGWNYYVSGADDEITLRENESAYSRIWLRPRVMRDVSKINMSTSFFGNKVSIPLYITATALGKLAHPDGECAMAKASYNENIIHMIATLASNSIEEIIQASPNIKNQTFWYQLYVNQDRQITKEMVQKAEKLGCKVLCITCDAPQLGRRERDMRGKLLELSKAPKVDQINKNKYEDAGNKQGGVAQQISKFIDPSLNWNDIAFFREITNMKIVLKGIQTVEDAIKSVEYGVDGIILSNHGGRQLDYARSGIEILVEVMNGLKKNNLQDKIEVYIDGGIRRGTDIFKAIALGAKGVGIGRPILYGLATYGQKGVERVIQLLKNELKLCMMLMGTPTLKDIKPEMVQVRNIFDHIQTTPENMLRSNIYEPMVPATSINSKL